MSLFGNPNKKIENIMKQLEKSGGSSTNYTARKNCGACKYFSAGLSHCNYHNKRTVPSEYCHEFWAK